MGATQNPLVGLQMDSETAHYVGILESQLAAHAIQEAKFRALLELLTGESWETTRIDLDANGLKKIAEDGLIKKAGLSRTDARVLVHKRWNNLTAGTAPTPKAVSIEEMAPESVAAQAVSPVSMADRLAGWKARQQNASGGQESVSEQVTTTD